MNIRRGLIGGGTIGLVCAVTVASRSVDPLPTFVAVLAFALACAALAVWLLVVLNRPPDPPARW